MSEDDKPPNPDTLSPYTSMQSVDIEAYADEILDNIADYEETDTKLPSVKIDSIGIENNVLKQKIEILHNLNTQNTTKYKEVELKLTVQYKQKEAEYIARIEELEQNMNKQRNGLRLLHFDSLSKQSSENQSLYEETIKYKQQIKSLQKKLSNQNVIIKKLQSRVDELEALSNQKDQQIAMHNDANKKQLALFTHELEQYRSLTPMHEGQSVSTVKIGKTSKSISSNVTITKQPTESTFDKQDADNTLTVNYKKGYSIPSIALVISEPDDIGSDDENEPNVIIHRKISTINFTETVSKSTEHTVKRMRSRRNTAHEPIAEDEETKDDLSMTQNHTRWDIYRTNDDKLVVKQLPFDNARTHFWMNVYIEKSKEWILVYLNRNCTVKVLLNELKSSDEIQGISNNDNVIMFCGNEDGKWDENVIFEEIIIADLGAINSCIVCKDDNIEIVTPLNPERSGFDEYSKGGVCCIVL